MNLAKLLRTPFYRTPPEFSEFKCFYHCLKNLQFNKSKKVLSIDFSYFKVLKVLLASGFPCRLCLNASNLFLKINKLNISFCTFTNVGHLREQNWERTIILCRLSNNLMN